MLFDGWQWTLYATLLALSALFSLWSAYAVHRPMPWTGIGRVLLIAGAAWALIHVLERLLPVPLPPTLRIGYLGLIVMPLLWLVFISLYAGRGQRLARHHLALLCALGLILLALAWFGGTPGMGVGYQAGGLFDPTRRLTFSHWGLVAYAAALTLWSCAMIVQIQVQSGGLYRRQAALLLGALLLPAAAGAAQALFRLQLDLLPAAFVLAALAVAWGLGWARRGDLADAGRSLALDETADGVLALDAQERIVYLNPTCQRLIASPEGRLVGRPAAQVWPAWARLELPAGAVEIDREWTPENGGPPRTVQLRLVPLLDWRDRLLGRIATLRDITPQRQAELALAAVLQEKEQLLDGVAEHVIYQDREHRVVWANRAACEAAGQECAALVGQPCYRVWLRYNGECPGCPARTAIDSGQPAHQEIASPDGHLWQVWGYPWSDAQGLIRGAIEVVTDLSEQERLAREKESLQAQLVQARKMEAIGTLAGGIAHDFNNLLTAIQGNATLARSMLDEDDPAYYDLEEIELACRRATRLTRQLLMFSRKEPIEPGVLSLNSAVSDLTYMLERLIGEDIEIDVRLAADLWPVHADQGSIEQVIINLVVNSRDAMPRGGQIVIETANEEIEAIPGSSPLAAEPGRFVRLSVSDTGMGMEAEVIDHLFEPFFSTKEVGKGTGLGLAVVCGIVQQHHGWVQAHSRVGHGSTFSVYLPASAPAEEGEEEPLPAPVSLQGLEGRGERILLVEDEKGVREFATRVLSQHGYQVVDVTDAADALQALEREAWRFDLVFSDVVLPDRSGLELADQILAHEPSFHLLLSSGYAGRRAQWETILARGYRFLQKPYTIVELLTAVREAIEK